jgi:hypothetical protein
MKKLRGVGIRSSLEREKDSLMVRVRVRERYAGVAVAAVVVVVVGVTDIRSSLAESTPTRSSARTIDW